MAGGARYKMNLDLSEEEFEKLSLRDMNEINIRMAKRLNESVKRWNKKSEFVSATIRMRYGEKPFSYKKAKSKNEAIRKYEKARNYIKKGFYDMRSYVAHQNKKNEQLAKNVDMDFLSETDKDELANFFSIMYRKLNIDAEILNYRTVCNQFIDYKMTTGEYKNMEDYIKENWNTFQTNNKKYVSKVEFNKRLRKFEENYEDI